MKHKEQNLLQKIGSKTILTGAVLFPLLFSTASVDTFSSAVSNPPPIELQFSSSQIDSALISSGQEAKKTDEWKRLTTTDNQFIVYIKGYEKLMVAGIGKANININPDAFVHFLQKLGALDDKLSLVNNNLKMQPLYIDLGSSDNGRLTAGNYSRADRERGIPPILHYTSEQVDKYLSALKIFQKTHNYENSLKPWEGTIIHELVHYYQDIAYKDVMNVCEVWGNILIIAPAGIFSLLCFRTSGFWAAIGAFMGGFY